MDKEKAKEAIRKINNCIMNDKCELIDCGYYCTLPYLEELSEYLNSIEKVVHCMDCKYYVKGEEHCVMWGMTFKDNFFCGSAEEREDEKEITNSLVK